MHHTRTRTVYPLTQQTQTENGKLKLINANANPHLEPLQSENTSSNGSHDSHSVLDNSAIRTSNDGGRSLSLHGRSAGIARRRRGGSLRLRLSRRTAGIARRRGRGSSSVGRLASVAGLQNVSTSYSDL